MPETSGFVELILRLEETALSFRVAPPAAKSTLRTVFYPPALFLALSDRFDTFEVCAGEEPEVADTEASGGGNRRCNATGSGLQFDDTCILCGTAFCAGR